MRIGTTEARPRWWWFVLFGALLLLPALASMSRHAPSGSSTSALGGARYGPTSTGRGLIANGESVSVSEAVDRSDFPVFRPNDSLASDQSLTGAWWSDSPPQVGFLYKSGVRVYAKPSELGDPTTFFKTQISEGAQGSIETVDGVPSLVVPPDKFGSPGSVDLVLSGVEVQVIGDYSSTDLVRVAGTLFTQAPAP